MNVRYMHTTNGNANPNLIHFSPTGILRRNSWFWTPADKHTPFRAPFHYTDLLNNQQILIFHIVYFDNHILVADVRSWLSYCYTATQSNHLIFSFAMIRLMGLPFFVYYKSNETMARPILLYIYIFAFVKWFAYRVLFANVLCKFFSLCFFATKPREKWVFMKNVALSFAFALIRIIHSSWQL